MMHGRSTLSRRRAASRRACGRRGRCPSRRRVRCRALPSARRARSRSPRSSRPGPARTSRDAGAKARRALADATTSWLESISSVLTLDVPRSMPRYMPLLPAVDRPSCGPPHFRARVSSTQILQRKNAIARNSVLDFFRVPQKLCRMTVLKAFLRRRVSVARRMKNCDSGLSGRAAARSADSADASAVSPARKAASISVRSMTSRCAWLPPKR